MRGRPNTPKEVKILMGTYRADRDKGVRNFGKIVDMPDPPEILSDIGKAIWTELCTILIDLKVLETVDVHLLGLAVNELATYWEMVQKIKEKGHVYQNMHGNMVKSPYVTIRNEALANSQRLLAQLGLTPAMRQRFGYDEDEAKETINRISLR